MHTEPPCSAVRDTGARGTKHRLPPSKAGRLCVAAAVPRTRRKVLRTQREGASVSAVPCWSDAGTVPSREKYESRRCVKSFMAVRNAERIARARAPRGSIQEPRPPQRQTCQWRASRDNDTSRPRRRVWRAAKDQPVESECIELLNDSIQERPADALILKISVGAPPRPLPQSL